jgi:hypothetical protein
LQEELQTHKEKMCLNSFSDTSNLFNIPQPVSSMTTKINTTDSLNELINPKPVNANQKIANDYQALCRGEDLLQMSAERQNKLVCRYVHHHPILRIAPVKEELVHDNPPIWLFHDVITDQQIEVFKSLALQKLETSMVVNPETGEGFSVKYRISQRLGTFKQLYKTGLFSLF